MKPIRGLIWDVDGTLSDTVDLCVSGLQFAIEQHGGPSYTRDEIIGMFGPTEEGILRDVVAEEAWLDAIETYLVTYRRGHADADLSFAEVIEVVRALGDTGIPMAIVTGKGDASCAITVEALGLDGMFDHVACGSMEGSVKAREIGRIVSAWGLAPSTVAYVGDSPNDVVDSRRAGVVSVGAAWKHDADVVALRDRDPDAIVRTVGELRSWIRREVDLGDLPIESLLGQDS